MPIDMNYIRTYAQSILVMVAKAEEQLKKHDAICLKGKFKGRMGSIEGVIADNDHGLRVLVMVYRDAPGKEFLNSVPDSRSYWPLKDIEVLL